MDANKNNKKNQRDHLVAEPNVPTVDLFREKLLASSQIEKPVTDVYDVFDNDLARDNMENDLTMPEIEALRHLWP